MFILNFRTEDESSMFFVFIIEDGGSMFFIFRIQDGGSMAFFIFRTEDGGSMFFILRIAERSCMFLQNQKTWYHNSEDSSMTIRRSENSNIL
jgi:hypothetical protein